MRIWINDYEAMILLSALNYMMANTYSDNDIERLFNKIVTKTDPVKLEQARSRLSTAVLIRDTFVDYVRNGPPDMSSYAKELRMHSEHVATELYGKHLEQPSAVGAL